MTCRTRIWYGGYQGVSGVEEKRGRQGELNVVHEGRGVEMGHDM